MPDGDRWPPESECSLCRLLGYRGDEIQDAAGVLTVARGDGGTKPIHACSRCPDELFDTHDWTAYSDLEREAGVEGAP